MLQVLAEGLRSKVQLSQKVVAHLTSDEFVISFCILDIRVSLIVLCVEKIAELLVAHILQTGAVPFTSSMFVISR